MNRLLRIFRLTLKYRKNLWLNLVFGWFSTFFGLFSLVLVAPLLEIIFYPQAQALGLPPVWELSRQGISTGLAYRLQLLSQNYGPQGALLAVCLIIIAAIGYPTRFGGGEPQHRRPKKCAV